ncbi:hypothetical protein C8J56DRAFT_1063288 [Mycena floridula]|nr:hypothetical protein C8J56DRAFT_1063288 [Mycena floridula]
MEPNSFAHRGGKAPVNARQGSQAPQENAFSGRGGLSRFSGPITHRQPGRILPTGAISSSSRDRRPLGPSSSVSDAPESNWDSSEPSDIFSEPPFSFDQPINTEPEYHPDVIPPQPEPLSPR